ncbi:hypothetical protein BMF94_4069 [Rhodotorula taiwanensis]|uniref:Uncharacterized protein n=1 Tax=Rhodotorula taiwanensis TaxID=741276 RepID=A0A2S5B804_9BASI|nr:hypothetical protein BMF94_4069 [Rhodotorula taiwanensis]
MAPSDTSHVTGVSGAAQHYPPYMARPAAQSASAPTAGTPLHTAASSAVGVATAGSGTAGATRTPEAGRFLQKAEDIEITKADRQASCYRPCASEGYDADLVNLPERNTAAAQPRPSIEQHKQPGEQGAPYAANLPYASRALGNEHSFESYHDSRDTSAKRLSGPGETTRNGVRHQSSTKGARDSGTKGRSAYRKSGRRRKRKLGWWERPWFLLLCIAVIVAIGLGVGLGIGLSQANKNKSSDSGSASGTTSGPPVEPSQSGATGDGSVQVSVSANNVAPTETTRPREPDSVTALASLPTLAPMAVVVEERRRRRSRW